MAKPRFAPLEVVFDNPPDKQGFATFTIVRTVGRSDHRYELLRTAGEMGVVPTKGLTVNI